MSQSIFKFLDCTLQTLSHFRTLFLKFFLFEDLYYLLIKDLFFQLQFYYLKLFLEKVGFKIIFVNHEKILTRDQVKIYPLKFLHLTSNLEILYN